MTAWPRLTSHTLRASSRICLFHLQQRLRTMIAGKHRSATIKVQFVESSLKTRSLNPLFMALSADLQGYLPILRKIAATIAPWPFQ